MICADLIRRPRKASPPSQSKLAVTGAHSQRWPAAASESQWQLIRPYLTRNTCYQWAGLAMLSKASPKLCSPVNPARILSKSNGIMEDNIADCCWISLTIALQRLITYYSRSTPPEVMLLDYRKLLEDDYNRHTRTARDTACMAKEGMLPTLIGAGQLLHQLGPRLFSPQETRLQNGLLQPDKQCH